VGDGGSSQKTLVWIAGPPAVGKMTVGVELSGLTGFPLFHNHVSIDAVLPVFKYGAPEFNRLVGRFRDHMFEEAAKSELPGLIFTMVWAFDLPSDRRFVERQKAVFEEHGGRVVFIELYADMETRLARRGTERRLTAKPWQRDTEASRLRMLEMEENYQLDSKGEFPFTPFLRIDNTHTLPSSVAEQIASHFGLAPTLTDSSTVGSAT
jgi:hypothetical protein